MSDVEAIKNEHEGLLQALKNEDVDWVTGHYAEDVSRFHQEGGLDIGWTSEKANDMHAQAAEIHNNHELISETVLQDETEWLGVEDSNLYWRSQSPQSYH